MFIVFFRKSDGREELVDLLLFESLGNRFLNFFFKCILGIYYL